MASLTWRQASYARASTRRASLGSLPSLHLLGTGAKCFGWQRNHVAVLEPVHPTQPASQHSSTVARFLPSNPELGPTSVRIPLEAQQLLGLPHGQLPKDSEVVGAYGALCEAPVEPGYSDLTVEGRLEVLDLVRQDVLSSKTKPRVPGSTDVALPSDLLPGALALMAEVGHCQLVLTLGRELLATVPAPTTRTPTPTTPAPHHGSASGQGPPADGDMEDGGVAGAYMLPPDALWRDLHLTLALAHCGLADEHLSHSGPTSGAGVSACMRSLQSALTTLEAAGEPPLSPGLHAHIEGGLMALRFQEALEAVSGPLHLPGAPASNKPESRKKALHTIREALKQVATPTSSAAQRIVSVGRESAEQVMECLSVEEVVGLMDWEAVARDPAAYTWVYPGLLEMVAVAHIVHGFACHHPAYIQLALGLVSRLPSAQQCQPDIKALAAVAHMLLGATQPAAQRLREAAAAAAGQQQQQDGGSAASHASSRLHASSSHHRQHEAALDPHTLPAARDAYAFVIMHTPGCSGPEADADAEAGGGDNACEDLLPGLCLFTQLWLQQAAFPYFRDTSTAPPNASLRAYFDDTRVEAQLNVYQEEDNSGALADSFGRAFKGIRRALRGDNAQRNSVTGGAGSAFSTHASGSDADGVDAGSSATGGAVARWAAAHPGAMRALLAGGLVLGGAVLGLMTPQGKRLVGWDHASQAAAVVQRAITVQPLATEPGVLLDVPLARQLIQHWEVVKSAALGPSHSCTPLPSVLAEPLLRQTLDKVATLEQHACYMRLTAGGLKVVSVQQVEPGPKGVPQMECEVVLQEDASLHADDGKQLNSYRNRYRMRYTVIQGKDGAWRISNALEEGTAA